MLDLDLGNEQKCKLDAVIYLEKGLIYNIDLLEVESLQYDKRNKIIDFGELNVKFLKEEQL